MFNNLKKGFNAEIGGVRINDVGEKIGSFFGEEGRKIGKSIDDATKNITIKYESNKSNRYR